MGWAVAAILAQTRADCSVTSLERAGAAGPELGRDVLDHSARATFTAADQRRCGALVGLPAA